jgi:hypothetical protein
LADRRYKIPRYPLIDVSDMLKKLPDRADFLTLRCYVEMNGEHTYTANLCALSSGAFNKNPCFDFNVGPDMLKGILGWAQEIKKIHLDFIFARSDEQGCKMIRVKVGIFVLTSFYTWDRTKPDADIPQTKELLPSLGSLQVSVEINGAETALGTFWLSEDFRMVAKFVLEIERIGVLLDGGFYEAVKNLDLMPYGYLANRPKPLRYVTL